MDLRPAVYFKHFVHRATVPLKRKVVREVKF
jgi:hypothetical protein